MQPQISIIMPAYNVEKYISVAIKSVINQTIGIEHLEIIIINDASTDKTEEIIDLFASKFKQIIAVHNKDRIRFPGNLRNQALKIATGECIMFLDSDDIMIKDSCKKMYESIKKFDSDIILGTYILLYDENGRTEPAPFFHQKKYQEPLINTNMKELYNKVQPTNDMITVEDLIKNPGPSWNKIYKREFLKKNNITFSENQITGEDYIFNHKCLLAADKISYIPIYICYYRRRSDTSNPSITQTFTTEIIKAVFNQKIETSALYRNTPYPYDKLTNYYFLSLFYYKIIERKNNPTAELKRIFEDINPYLHMFNLEDTTLASHARILFKYIYFSKYDEAIKHITTKSN